MNKINFGRCKVNASLLLKAVAGKKERDSVKVKGFVKAKIKGAVKR